MPIISVEKLNNANLDAETIEQVVNGEPNVLVESREGRKIPTLATLGEKQFSAGVILYGEKTQEQVNDEVGNALTGLSFANKTYATVAAANADIANIAVNQSVWVSSEAEGGLYEKSTAGATSLTKSAFDPVELSKQYVESKATVVRKEFGGNLNDLTSEGRYFSTTGNATTANNYPFSEGCVIDIKVTSWAALSQDVTSIVTGKKAERFKNAANTWSNWFFMTNTQDVQSAIASEVSSNAKITAKLITPDISLDTYTAQGEYYCSSSANAKLEYNFPVAEAGVLKVEVSDWAQIQTYTSFATGTSYKRRKTSETFAAWEIVPNVSYVANQLYPSHLEWQQVSNGSLVYFDPSTKTVTIPDFILAPSNLVANNRVRINGVSVTFSSQYQVCYIDLRDLKTVSNIDSSNQSTYLKVKTYSEADGFLLKSGQIPLFSYNSLTNEVTSASGFLKIITKYGGRPINKDQIAYSKTAGTLSVFLPTSSEKYLRVNMWRQVVSAADQSIADSNSDIWRINALHVYHESLSYAQQQLVTDGEWSCALWHKNDTQGSGITKDHVGGWHGDEVQVSTEFFIDGIRYEQSFTSGLKSAIEIVVTMKSVIYFQGTSTPLCDHYQIFTFNKDGLNLKQKIDFKYSAVTLQRAWITMFPVIRQVSAGLITSHSTRSTEYHTQVDDNSSTSFTPRGTYQLKDGFSVRQWGNLGFSAEITMLRMPNKFANQGMFITNAAQYNKVYVAAVNPDTSTTDYSVALNDVWEVEAAFKFDIAI